MKKIFAFGLMLLLFGVLIQFVTPIRMAPDDDVGICYVASMEEVSLDVANFADNNSYAYSDPRSSLLLTVEKASFIVSDLSNFELQCMNSQKYFWQSTTAITENRERQLSKERGYRLDIGEPFPQGGGWPRHII